MSRAGSGSGLSQRMLRTCAASEVESEHHFLYPYMHAIPFF